MEDNTQAQMIRIIDKKDLLGNPASALTFIFTMLAMEFWGIYQGIFTGPTALAIGVTQVACFVPYMIGATFFFIKGDSINGNAFLIFATLFGGVGGFGNVLAGIAEIKGWEVCTQMSAIPFIWGGISILPVLWVIRKAADKATFICFLAAALFLAFAGFVTLNVLGPDWNLLIKWLALITAVTGFYSCLNGLLVSGGSKGLPVGKPFFTDQRPLKKELEF